MQRGYVGAGATRRLSPPIKWRARRPPLVTQALIVERDWVLAPEIYGQPAATQYAHDLFMECVKPIADSGFPVIILADFEAVGAGHVKRWVAWRVLLRTVSILHRRDIRVYGFVCCTHTPEQACSCRKPSTGQLEICRDEFNIELERSAYLGAKLSDLEAGITVGIPTFLVSPQAASAYAQGFEKAHEALLSHA